MTEHSTGETIMTPQQITNELSKQTLHLDALHVSDPIHIRETPRPVTQAVARPASDTNTDPGSSIVDSTMAEDGRSIASSLSSHYARAMMNPTPFSTPTFCKEDMPVMARVDSFELGGGLDPGELSLMFGEVEEALHDMETGCLSEKTIIDESEDANLVGQRMHQNSLSGSKRSSFLHVSEPIQDVRVTDPFKYAEAVIDARANSLLHADSGKIMSDQEEYFDCANDFEENTRKRTLSMYSVHSIDAADMLWADC